MSHVTVVVDTDVVSLTFKRDTRSAIYDRHLAGGYAAISFMTLAELERWTLERNWGTARRKALASVGTDKDVSGDLRHW